MKSVSSYFYDILISIDQFVNTLIGGRPDETLSSHAYRLRNSSKCSHMCYLIIDGIFLIFGQKDHCHQSYISERNRTQLPDEFQEGL